MSFCLLIIINSPSAILYILDILLLKPEISELTIIIFSLTPIIKGLLFRIQYILEGSVLCIIASAQVPFKEELVACIAFVISKSIE